MPIYEFQCSKCGKKFEELAKQGSKVKCLQCGVQAKKLFSSFGFKSSGKMSTNACGTCKPSSGCKTCKS